MYIDATLPHFFSFLCLSCHLVLSSECAVHLLWSKDMRSHDHGLHTYKGGRAPGIGMEDPDFDTFRGTECAPDGAIPRQPATLRAAAAAAAAAGVTACRRERVRHRACALPAWTLSRKRTREPSGEKRLPFPCGRFPPSPAPAAAPPLPRQSVSDAAPVGATARAPAAAAVAAAVCPSAPPPTGCGAATARVVCCRRRRVADLPRARPRAPRPRRRRWSHAAGGRGQTPAHAARTLLTGAYRGVARGRTVRGESRKNFGAPNRTGPWSARVRAAGTQRREAGGHASPRSATRVHPHPIATPPEPA